MDFTDGLVSDEYRELVRSASECADPLSASPMPILISSNSPRSRKSPRSLKVHGKGSPANYDKHSHSPRDGRPKKGGCDGKGTWGGLLDTDHSYSLDSNDPNYDSSEEYEHPNERKLACDFDAYKNKATTIVEEYFATDVAVSATNELEEPAMPSYNYYFVKKLVSMAMDRHDQEKEMASILLSAFYANVIDAPQVYSGFSKLVESADDLIVDIPDTVDVLALFIAELWLMIYSLLLSLKSK